MGSTFDYTYEERQRDINAGLYVPFYIESPVGDLEVTIGDETTEVISVTCQVVDPGGEPITGRQQVRMTLFDSADYDALKGAAPTGVTVDPATGSGIIFQEVGEDYDVIYLTDDAGEIILEWTDAADGGEEFWMGFTLPSGKFVEGGKVLFVDDTP